MKLQLELLESRDLLSVAAFAGLDVTTQGNWIGSYGSQAYFVVDDAQSFTSTLSVAGNNDHNDFIYQGSTPDPRALQRTDGNGNIAAVWFNESQNNRNTFAVNVNLTDNQPHSVSFYVLDWDKGNRSERLDVVDPANGSVLTSQLVNNFVGGTYVTFTVTGNVQVRLTNVGGPNAVLSGVFIDPVTTNQTISTVTNGVLSIIANNQTNYLVVSTPTTGVTEVFDAVANSTQDFTGVTTIVFQAGRGNTTFYNNTSLPSTQTAGNGPSTYLLVGGTGNDTLIGGSSPASTTFEQDPSGSNLLVAGAGDSNLFGGKNNDTIVAGGKSDEVYDILGTNNVLTVGNPNGYLIVNATSVTQAGKNQAVITFILPTPVTTPSVMLTQDVNGNGILWINPAVATGETFIVNQAGKGKNAILIVNYSDANGSQTFFFPKASVQWIASFGTPANDVMINNTSVNSVFYGAAGADVLIGGTGINVLKGHSGNDILVANGTYNDVSAGPGSAVLTGSSTGFNIFRNATNAVSTTDENVNRGDVVVGVPILFNAVTDTDDVDTVADNADYQDLYFWLAGL